jgi:hypothetical protein
MTTTTRRGALGALLVSVPALALPGGAMSAATAGGLSAHPDADLFALIAAAREAEARFEAATEALADAEKRTEEVPEPQALIVTEKDVELFWESGLAVGASFDFSHVNSIRREQSPKKTWLAKLAAPRGPREEPLDEKTAAMFQWMVDRDRRANEIIAADDQWIEERKRAKERSGERAVQERQEQLCGEMSEARERVGSTRARTLAGMLAKLALIAPEFEDEEEWASDVGTSEMVLISVAADYRLGVEGA